MISSGYSSTEGLGLFLSHQDSCRIGVLCVGWVPEVKLRDGIARE